MVRRLRSTLVAAVAALVLVVALVAGAAHAAAPRSTPADGPPAGRALVTRVGSTLWDAAVRYVLWTAL